MIRLIPVSKPGASGYPTIQWPQTVSSAAILLTSLIAGALGVLADGTLIDTPAPRPAPPPAPPIQHRDGAVATADRGGARLSAIPPGLILYSIGEPTDEEQLYLEYINRARRDPVEEGLRLWQTTDPELTTRYAVFGVDLELMASQFAALVPAPPLSMSAPLTFAARLHSQDMLAHAFQGHIGSDQSSFTQRAEAQGYPWLSMGENVYAYATSVEEGHAGFQVDWGGDESTGGMQDPPGHRLSIHDPSFREVGIGVIKGSNGSVGPQIVTQSFGTQQGATPFITGVVYYDLNLNGLYDPGEGLGGATILVNGAPHYAVSSGSGGYSVPVASDGDYAVTFSVPGLAGFTENVAVRGQNVKVDYPLIYSPPAVSGPGTIAVHQEAAFSFTSVAGATGYRWKVGRLVPGGAFEGAENGLAAVTALISPGYEVIDNTVRASGTSSFHLAHPRTGEGAEPPEDQFLALNRVFLAGASAELTFASRLSWASPRQVARAQITIDDGRSWENLWSQSGTYGAGQSSFTMQRIPLESFAGREFQVRFVYAYLGGQFFPQTDSGVGFYIDDIAVLGADEIINPAISDLAAGDALTVVAEEPGRLALSVRPVVGDRFLPWGPVKLLTAELDPAAGRSVRMLSIDRLSDGRLQIEFVATPPDAAYEVWHATDLAGAWSAATAASIQRDEGSSRFHVLLPPDSRSQGFYRVMAR